MQKDVQTKNILEKNPSMPVELNKLFELCRDCEIEEFAGTVYPEQMSGSDYVKDKYRLFHENLTYFWAQLDYEHRHNFARLYFQKFGSADKHYCELVEDMKVFLKGHQSSRDSPALFAAYASEAQRLLDEELNPYLIQLYLEKRLDEHKVIARLVERLEAIANQDE